MTDDEMVEVELAVPSSPMDAVALLGSMAIAERFPHAYNGRPIFVVGDEGVTREILPEREPSDRPDEIVPYSLRFRQITRGTVNRTSLAAMVGSDVAANGAANGIEFDLDEWMSTEPPEDESDPPLTLF